MTDVNTEAPNVPLGDFARDCQVTAVAGQPGTFRGELSEAWRVFYAFGGATMALALRAAATSVDRPELEPVSATATFAAPVPCGPMTIDTRVLRSGRSAAQVTADLRSGEPDDRQGEADVHLTAVFGSPHDSHVEFTDVEFPTDAATVEASEPPPPPPPGSPFMDINYRHQTEWRAADGGGGISGQNWQPGGRARSLSWHRLINEARRADGTIDPISLCLPADVLGPALFAKLGPLSPDNPPFLSLSLEIALHIMAPTSSSWLLQHTRVPQVGHGYAFGLVELWDTEERLVAVATQRAHVRNVDPARFAAPDGTA